TGNVGGGVAAEAASVKTEASATVRMMDRRSTNPPSARGSGCAAGSRSSDSGLPSPPPSQAVAQWRRGGEASPLTAAGPSRTLTGVPLPLAGLERESSIPPDEGHRRRPRRSA